MENNREPFHKTFRWIRGIFLKGEPVIRLECRHIQASDSGQRNSHRLLELEAKELQSEPEEIATQIIEEATQDAKNFHGMQSYALFYYTEKGGNECRGRHVFSIAGSIESEDDFSMGSTEPANEKGLLSQMMRHVEAKERSTNQNHQSQIHFYETRLTQQERYLTIMSDKMMHLFELINTVEDRKLEREIEYRKLMRQEKTKDMAMEKLAMFTPVLLHKLLGAAPSNTNSSNGNTQNPDIPQGIDPRLLPLLESLNEEQMMTIANTMNDEQKVAFIEIYTSYRDLKKKEKDEKHAAE